MEECDFLDVVIREYGNRDDYLNDRFGDPDIPKNPNDPEDHGFIYSRTAEGNPKGMLLDRHIFDPDTGKSSHKYYYPPVLEFNSEEEENEWLKNWAQEVFAEIQADENAPQRILDLVTHQKERYSIRYWYVEEWHCTKVKRDREWFAKRYPDFENFWKLVTKCRAEGIPDEVPAPVAADTEDAPVSRNPSFVRTVSRPRVKAEPKPTTSEDCLFLDDD